MKNHRNNKYISIITLLAWNLLFAILLFVFLIKEHQNPFQITSVITLFSLFGFTTLVSSTNALIIIFSINKMYDQQYKKYKNEFVMDNKKREISALKMVIFTSILVYPLFVMINAWFKSGLSKKQKIYAERSIRIKGVDNLLQQDAVKKSINNNSEIKQKIKDVIEIREAELDTEYNSNLFILHLLHSIKAEYKIIYNEKEVYYIGMNF